MRLDKSEEIFLASLLGDGSLSLMDGKYLYYSEMHSLKQKDYLLWKLKHMSKMFNFANSSYYFDKYDKRTEKIYKHIKINSSDSKKLKKYYDLFYKNGKKIVTKSILYELSSLGMATWYMDDGTYSYNGKSVSIATDNFTYNEHLIIKDFLKKKFDVDCNIRLKDNRYNIYFDVKNTAKFINILSPFIHESMFYKLGHFHESNNDKILKVKKQISNNKRAYYLKNRDKIIDYQRKYRKENKDKISIRNRIYLIENKEKIRDKKRQYRILNRDGLLAKNKEYYKKNKNKINKRKKYFLQKNEQNK